MAGTATHLLLNVIEVSGNKEFTQHMLINIPDDSSKTDIVVHEAMLRFRNVHSMSGDPKFDEIEENYTDGETYWFVNNSSEVSASEAIVLNRYLFNC